MAYGFKDVNRTNNVFHVEWDSTHGLSSLYCYASIFVSLKTKIGQAIKENREQMHEKLVALGAPASITDRKPIIKLINDTEYLLWSTGDFEGSEFQTDNDWKHACRRMVNYINNWVLN